MPAEAGMIPLRFRNDLSEYIRQPEVRLRSPEGKPRAVCLLAHQAAVFNRIFPAVFDKPASGRAEDKGDIPLFTRIME